MTTRRPAVLSLVTAIAFAIAACGSSPSPSSSPAPATRTPAPATPAPTASPSPSPTPALPEGLVAADIPSAGIRLPVPAGWELVDEAALADESVQADVVARYPGMGPFLEAAAQLGERARPAFLALDPSAEGSGVAITPTVAVLVAQPAVRGPLLDFVAGFIADGLAETFGSDAPAQARVDTPVGEAIRMSFALPADGDMPMAATAWVIGADEATLLVAVIGPADAPPARDPDALIRAAEPLQTP